MERKGIAEDKTYNGRKFVFVMFFGFIAFTLVGLLLTWAMAQALTPGLKRKFDEEQRIAKERREAPRPSLR